MIQTLSISDFALVDKLELSFAPGFTALTGETGAGKSILLKALGLLLGERADRELVRTGAALARVEGVFELEGPTGLAARGIIEEAGAEWEELLVVARTVGAEGKSRAFVNGCSVGVATLARLGALLVEVSSQHQHQSLLDEKQHLSILDRALDAEGLAAFESYQRVWEAFEKASGEVARLKKLEDAGGERRDFLTFQVGEIRAASLKPGEDEELKARRDILANAEKLFSAYNTAHAEVFGDADSALARTGRALKHVEKAALHDPAAEEALALLREAEIALGEAAAKLSARASASVVGPGEADEVEGRLEIIDRLRRKHGKSVDEVLAKLEKMEAELDALENREEAIAAAARELEKAGAALADGAKGLTASRTVAARKLEGLVGAELSMLGFSTAAFSIALTPEEHNASGADEARFMFAPNRGEEAKPLAAIASGGELSRVLLAVKNALRDGSVGTLVFDEVDAGIGGRTADMVGERLKALSSACQVLCVTHLPQIASKAGDHQLVAKDVEAGRTITRVARLSGEERIAELARMLGGGETPDAAWQHARELAERGRVA